MALPSHKTECSCSFHSEPSVNTKPQCSMIPWFHRCMFWWLTHNLCLWIMLKIKHLIQKAAGLDKLVFEKWTVLERPIWFIISWKHVAYNFSVMSVVNMIVDVFSVILFILLWPASAHVLHNGPVLFILLLFFMPLLLSLLTAVLKIFSLHFGSGSGFCHLGNQSYPITKILSQWR